MAAFTVREVAVSAAAAATDNQIAASAPATRIVLIETTFILFSYLYGDQPALLRSNGIIEVTQEAARAGTMSRLLD